MNLLFARLECRQAAGLTETAPVTDLDALAVGGFRACHADYATTVELLRGQPDALRGLAVSAPRHERNDDCAEDS